MAAGEPVRRHDGDGFVAPPAREHKALLQRRRGQRKSRVDLASSPLPRGGADHPVLHRDVRVREVHRPDREGGDDERMRRAVAIVDGEHYPPVVRQALEELDDLVVAAVLIGGTEKLRGGEGYGVPLEPSVESAVREHGPDVVIDLSDEPVLTPPDRLALASRVLALGLPYEGPDFRFEPPRFEPVGLPSVAVIGTGKRVGKTAVTGHVARRLALSRRVAVVAMGRGGPPDPEIVPVPPTV